MGLTNSDFTAVANKGVVVVLDSYDEVLPSVREGVEQIGGLVNLLVASVGESALRRVVVSSRPEAVISNPTRVLGHKAHIFEHWIMPFTLENFEKLAEVTIARSVFELVTDPKKDKQVLLNTRYQMEGASMIDAAPASHEGVSCAEILHAMREARHKVVEEHDRDARQRAIAEGLQRSKDLVSRVRAIPELQALIATPVLAAMLCRDDTDRALLEELAKPRVQPLTRGEIYRLLLIVSPVRHNPEGAAVLVQALQDLALELCSQQTAYV
eukprot:RCo019930